MTHRCGSRSAAADPAKSALAEDRLSMYRQAPHIARRMSGIHIQPASAMLSVAPAPIVTATGTANCATAVPRLPPAALRPRAQPFSFCGKKYVMLAIELA